MNPFRKHRRPGNRPMTQDEAARVVEAKVRLCIPCLVWAGDGHMPVADVANCCDYDHSKSGNIRRGHRYGFASCLWHHRGRVPDDWTHQRMRLHYGPSRMDGSRLFHDTYGSEDELIEIQDMVLAREAAGEVV